MAVTKAVQASLFVTTLWQIFCHGSNLSFFGRPAAAVCPLRGNGRLLWCMLASPIRKPMLFRLHLFRFFKGHSKAKNNYWGDTFVAKLCAQWSWNRSVPDSLGWRQVRLQDLWWATDWCSEAARQANARGDPYVSLPCLLRHSQDRKVFYFRVGPAVLKEMKAFDPLYAVIDLYACWNRLLLCLALKNLVRAVGRRERRRKGPYQGRRWTDK